MQNDCWIFTPHKWIVSGGGPKLFHRTDHPVVAGINGFKNGLLSKMRLKDNFGQTTYLTFTDVMVDTSIDTNRFEFAVPEGADVFNEIVEQ